MNTKLTLNTVCAIPKDDVVAREIHGEFIIVPVTAGIGDSNDDLFSMNKTGQTIWYNLNGKKSLKDNIDELSLKFEAPAGEIEGDVLGFTKELLRRKMVIERKEGNRKKESGVKREELGEEREKIENKEEKKEEKAEAEKQEREVPKKKEKWEKPQLIVLVRGKPEEMVLQACKGNPEGGPDETDDACFVNVSTCIPCENSTVS